MDYTVQLRGLISDEYHIISQECCCCQSDFKDPIFLHKRNVSLIRPLPLQAEKGEGRQARRQTSYEIIYWVAGLGGLLYEVEITTGSLFRKSYYIGAIQGYIFSFRANLQTCKSNFNNIFCLPLQKKNIRTIQCLYKYLFILYVWSSRQVLLLVYLCTYSGHTYLLMGFSEHAKKNQFLLNSSVFINY